MNFKNCNVRRAAQYMRLRMTTAPAKKHVSSMSVMPADGILAARRPDKDFGTSRFKGN